LSDFDTIPPAVNDAAFAQNAHRFHHNWENSHFSPSRRQSAAQGDDPVEADGHGKLLDVREYSASDTVLSQVAVEPYYHETKVGVN
jgi:hypothetical protein